MERGSRFDLRKTLTRPAAALFLTVLLAASLVRAQQMSAPPLPMDVSGLRQAYIESVDSDRKKDILAALAKVPPVSRRDVSDLFDLFMRFQDTRDSVLSSLSRMDTNSPALEPVFLADMQSDEPDGQFFGLMGALRLNDRTALPLIEKIADHPMPLKDPRFTPFISQRKAWWLEYNALTVIAQWKGPEALKLLKRRAKESPAVARIMAGYLWKDSLPLFEDWAHEKKMQAAAQEGLSAAVPPQALRDTRPDMMKILLDGKADRDLRHWIAIKVGLSSTEDEIGDLLKQYNAEKDPETKLMISAALFASRSPQVIPLLTQTAKEAAQPEARLGALGELKDLLKPADYKSLLEWVAAKDPDPDNRQKASEELKK